MPRSAHLLAALASACTLATLGAAQATETKVITFPAVKSAPATLKLLPAEGKVGRDTPFYSNYRPQVWFSAENEGITCAVQLPPPREKVEPGETADVQLSCLEAFRSFEKRPQFTVTQGGRLVAEGVLR
jgi:translation elongation factor EF-Tu-like GTPase